MMDYITIGIVAVIVLSLGVFINKAYRNGPSSSLNDGYTTLTPPQAKARMDREKDSVILDVRTPKEYSQGHLDGSILIPLADLESESPKKLPDKDAPVFVLGRTGVRSRAASKKLVFLGYTNVFNIGGIEHWPYQ